MQSLYAQIQFGAQRDTAYSILEGMQGRLEKARLKPNANQSFLDSLQQEILGLTQFIETASNAIIELEASVSQKTKEAYQRGRRHGNNERATGHSSPAAARFHLGREAFRRETISRARQQWPELYQGEPQSIAAIVK